MHQSVLIYQARLMYMLDHEPAPRRRPARVPAVGRSSLALAPAERAGPKRPPGPRADRPGRRAAEPGLLSPEQAAGRPAGLGAAQLGRRAGHLLRAGPGANWWAPLGRRRGAPP